MSDPVSSALMRAAKAIGEAPAEERGAIVEALACVFAPWLRHEQEPARVAGDNRPMTPAERSRKYRHEKRHGDRDDASRESVTERDENRDGASRLGGKGGSLSSHLCSPLSEADPRENDTLSTVEAGAPPDAGALVFAWEAGASEAAGKPIGLRRKERQDLYDLVRVFARIHHPGPERASALQRTVARYVAYVRTLDAAERRYHPVTPAAVIAWLNEGSLEAAAEAEAPDRASGVRKASEPQRATFTVPRPTYNGGAGGGV